LPKNPCSGNQAAPRIFQSREKLAGSIASRSLKKTNAFVLSDQAAQLIAKVLKSMLNSKP
jgi:hypothetical protein